MSGSSEEPSSSMNQLIYASPAITDSAFQIFVTCFALTFYNKKGVEMASLAFIMALSGSIGLISRIFAQYLSSSSVVRTRRIPFLSCIVPFYAIVFYLICTASTDGMDSKALTFRFAWTSIAFQVLYSFVDVLYHDLGNALDDTSETDNNLYFAAELGQITGVAVSVVCLICLLVITSSMDTAMKLYSYIFGIGLYFCIISLGFGLHEPRESDLSNSSSNSRTTIAGSLIHAWNDTAFRPLLIGRFLDWMNIKWMEGLFPLHFVINLAADQSVLGLEMSLSIGLLIVFITTVVGIGLWKKLGGEDVLGKFGIWKLSTLAYAFSTMLVSIPNQGQTQLFFFIAAIRGLTGGGGLYMGIQLLSQVIDHASSITGRDETRSYKLAYNYVGKIGRVIGGSLVVLSIVVCQYSDPSDGEFVKQNETVMTFMKYVYPGIGCLLHLISYLFIQSFPHGVVSSGGAVSESAEVKWSEQNMNGLHSCENMSVSSIGSVVMNNNNGESVRSSLLVQCFVWAALFVGAAFGCVQSVNDGEIQVLMGIASSLVGLVSFVALCSAITERSNVITLCDEMKANRFSKDDVKHYLDCVTALVESDGSKSKSE